MLARFVEMQTSYTTHFDASVLLPLILLTEKLWVPLRSHASCSTLSITGELLPKVHWHKPTTVTFESLPIRLRGLRY
jgi:hypothetical protein